MEFTVKENVAIDQELDALLNEHRVNMGQVLTVEPVENFSFALYQDDTFVGGLTARAKSGEFYIILLAVTETHREQGIGKQLMQLAENKARELGCHHLLLTTYSYQGIHFYPAVGFQEMSRITDYPELGVDKVYFIKYL